MHTRTDAAAVAKTNRAAVSERMLTIFLRVSQFLTWPIAFLYFHSLYRLHISGRENLRLARAPFIIVANHIDFFDSFLFRLILGFWTPHLPLRFMAVERFSWRWLNLMARIGVIAFVYRLFGVFTVVPGRGLERNLRVALDIIAGGGNIVIYPEGKVHRTGGIADFKPGAAALAIATRVPVVPVVLRFGKRVRLRRSLSVAIGKPFMVSDNSSVAEATNELRNKVVGMLW